MSRPAEATPPQEFEEYRLLRPLGHGAMGQVFLARDTLLDRLVAVKFIVPSGQGEAARTRFFLEARALARLQHPNVVSIHRVGEVRRQPYLVSEFIRGESLDRLPRPVEGRRVLRIAIGLARGLAAAHRCGVLHRDIKPANAVLSEDGEVKLVDFGLAELLEDAHDGGSRAVRLATAASQAVEPSEALRTRPRPAPAGGAGETAPRPPPVPAGETRPLSGNGAPPAEPLSQAETRESPAPDAGAAGTPLYLAPELWRGEPASRASDIYALGVLLHELCTGKAPHEDVPLPQLARAVQEEPPRPLAGQALDLVPGLAAVVDRCLAADPAARFDSGDALREALESLEAPASAGALPTGNPYRGLQPFDSEHRRVFFGREAEQREVLDRLRASPFVLVAGDSGVGKSSLCRAAVLPALSEAGLAEGEAPWGVASFSPGRRPLEALAEALAPVLGESADVLLSRLGSEPGSLALALRQRPSEAPRVLLFVDQLEELVTVAEPGEAARLAEVLALLVRRAPRARLLATARGDCLTRLMALPGLGDELPHGLYLMKALSARALHEAIVTPARMLGVRFESEALVETLVAEATRTEGGLPLLQFALAGLWDARDRERRLIPAAALEAMGGVGGALARHADGVVAQLRPEQRPLARELLLKLVTPEGTRAHRTEAELLGDGAAPDWRAVLEGLVRGRLLAASEAEQGEGSYVLAHESLLTGWDTLRGWLGHDEQRRAAHQRLERAAAEWVRLGRPAELLYADRLLAEAALVEPRALGTREAEFLSRSRRAARGRRLRRWAVAVAAPLLVLSGVGVVRYQAHAQRAAAVSARLDEARTHWEEARARAAEGGRLRQEALVTFDTPGQRQAAEAQWAHVLEVGRAADAAYRRTSNALEAAWTLDPERTQARELLGDLLAEQVVLAERDMQHARREELLARLVAFDTTGERRRQLETPAVLSVSIRPAGARVRLLGPEGAEAGARSLGEAPLRDVSLPPGSHLLRVEAPGRAPVRLPVLLRPGERRELVLELPEAASVPEGFLYIPKGRFLQGSADDESMRQSFLNTAPLHEVETEAYLIARHEVTFAEWMAFLEALPPTERARHLPSAQAPRKVVQLEPLPKGRWRLTLHPTAVTYQVLDGQPVHYGRPGGRRAVQDWRRFPVSGVSYDSAVAYAAWLEKTGRVPGARVCTEWEWERAARGADGRRFPSGERLKPDDANHDVTYERTPEGYGPDEVGSHPRSRSPYGVEDMAGNVWELVRSSFEPDAFVIRGGSWYQGDLSCQSANREPAERTLRDPTVGLRLCATPRAP